jgi:hypothetical protein
MKPTLTKIDTLMGAKSYAEDIQAEQEVTELDMEELEAVAGGSAIVMMYL